MKCNRKRNINGGSKKETRSIRRYKNCRVFEKFQLRRQHYKWSDCREQISLIVYTSFKNIYLFLEEKSCVCIYVWQASIDVIPSNIDERVGDKVRILTRMKRSLISEDNIKTHQWCCLSSSFPPHLASSSTTILDGFQNLDNDLPSHISVLLPLPCNQFAKRPCFTSFLFLTVNR